MWLFPHREPRRPQATPEPDAEYVRRAYDRAIDWYKVAEAKAQLLLTVNGLLVTVYFAVLTGKAGPADRAVRQVGVGAGIFAIVSAAAVIGATGCAAGALWSRHTGNIKEAFPRLAVEPADPGSYRPEVLWYFGHIAHLDGDAAARMIGGADRRFEVTALSYNLVNLSHVVLRKHQFVNLGWALTATAIVSLVLAGAALLIQVQL
ncbi:hypothetical protein [Actinoplanes sp. NPDC049681]|uniref:hypothetical protein n=1 Tax=Actinoplanes sp. NPDC049681 TaxID=3363905 RepID=UPI0037AC0570